MKNNLWQKWVLYCAAGELAGIAVAGAIAFAAGRLLGEPETFFRKCAVLVFMLTAGAVEGTLLGFFQGKVLVLKFPILSRREWLRYTVLAAVAGWFMGMLPSLFFIPEGSTGSGSSAPGVFGKPFIQVLLTIGAGLLLGGLFGWFQWFSLRKHAQKAYRWIVANALGWGAGMGWIYLFASLPGEDTGLLFHVLMGVAGGLLAGLSVGAVTGWYLVKLEPLQHDQS